MGEFGIGKCFHTYEFNIKYPKRFHRFFFILENTHFATYFKGINKNQEENNGAFLKMKIEITEQTNRHTKTKQIKCNQYQSFAHFSIKKIYKTTHIFSEQTTHIIKSMIETKFVKKIMYLYNFFWR